jgi:hypothetical protein
MRAREPIEHGATTIPSWRCEPLAAARADVARVLDAQPRPHILRVLNVDRCEQTRYVRRVRVELEARLDTQRKRARFGEHQRDVRPRLQHLVQDTQAI